jgi:hypothetical protein
MSVRAVPAVSVSIFARHEYVHRGDCACTVAPLLGFFTHDDGRLVLAAACTLISFYFESAKSLTSEERLFVIKVAVPRLRRSVSFELPVLVEVDWIIQHEYLTIDLAPFVRGAVERLGGGS